MSRKKLPIGIQTFAKIREDDYYYVDKTAFALSMIEEGTAYFLSRPRRFGKSLFLDTLAELFAGNEPLFRGLHCHDKWNWTTKYPVIRISFGGGVMASREELDDRIHHILSENASRLGVSHGKGSIPNRFIALIQAAEARFSQRVAVLVDEYDKPILDNLTTPELAHEMRDGLRNLYSVIKGQDAHIKFAMLTGVSKFSKVNIFSGLNNLKDITLNAAYSGVCGYTDADVDTVFAPELAGLDRDEIRHWYNGYNWCGESVYNPFDLLLLFDCREFRPFWFETGTPTFLVEMLAERKVFLPRLEHLDVSAALLSSFDVGDISTEALLFQAGYLTIQSSRHYGAQIRYRLRFPNQEVRASFGEAMLLRLRPEPENSFRLFDLLRDNDFSGMQALIHALFAGIPTDWYRRNDIEHYEGYYASVFYAFFSSTGLEVIPEDSSNAGRLDMAVKFNGQVYLFEFKLVEEEAEGRALSQIKEKGYADKYQALAQPIYLIGVEFSKKERNVVGFAVERLGT
jgi:hypothetical protein